MANRWIKCNLLLGCSVSLWLLALSPTPKIVRAFCYAASLISVIKLIQESQILISDIAREKVIVLMNEELQQTEIALHTYQQEQVLQATYSETYNPEVRKEINQSLEHLLENENAEHPVETSTSTNELKTAIMALLDAGKSRTFIIENVLGYKGRKFEEGKKKLSEILGE
jgi:hypothetical protein